MIVVAPPLPVKSPSLTEDEELTAYEIPRPDDNDYEDVDSCCDRTYSNDVIANDVIVSGGHVMRANRLGYVVMASKPPLTSSATSLPRV